MWMEKPSTLAFLGFLAENFKVLVFSIYILLISPYVITSSFKVNIVFLNEF